MQERLSLLERQMHLITELAASEFTILSLTEEVEEANANINMLQEENALLWSECGTLQNHVRCPASFSIRMQSDPSALHVELRQNTSR